MKVRVRYFGIVREKLKLGGEDVECAAGSRVRDLMTELARRHDILSLGAGSIRVAVNLEYADGDCALADDDEVAIIPPVAGGCDRPAAGRDGS